MKVKDLIAILQTQDADREVIMQGDSEGNYYRPLVDIWTGAYQPKSGAAGLESLTDKDRKDREEGYSENDLIMNGQAALFLVPE